MPDRLGLLVFPAVSSCCIEGEVSVTRNTEEMSAEAIRQAKHREKMDEAGFAEVRAELGEATRTMLAELREARGGHTGPYTLVEYLDTTIRRDYELLQQEQGVREGVVCTNCRKPLPRGCGGFFAREGACLRAVSDRALAL